MKIDFKCYHKHVINKFLCTYRPLSNPRTLASTNKKDSTGIR